ncbi:IS5 family transposase [Streptomyces inhibens]|uniref:IS5 family transposase n=1 Tax=Streptomyces inhibens TaxID=2293571 RepID=UPI00379B4BF3
MGDKGDLTDVQWERFRPLLPVSNGSCRRWRDHRQVINGVLYRIRIGVQWRDVPERYGPWKTVHERHCRWSAAGTWELLLQRVQAEADATGDIDWDVSVDATSVRAHSARSPSRPSRSGSARDRQDSAWTCLTAWAQQFVSAGPGVIRRRGMQPPDGLPRYGVLLPQQFKKTVNLLLWHQSCRSGSN